ncbi:hypothetical protein CONCODRAFT_12492 [Conidiobolus coronatus NRRL 28638]|uniref:RNI-like protein n=1 Tax=Conidiobolus coronatus (strain ATCC 28846 / CBS 209.66 / NRRL 28638) TaxID=796925 RepID=A0A137NSR7_CONC2|nr:hypothetical protein CONCODRAFT_12492 [Conidiobolus coronatus NRRL 28638]|eukprot:KXN65817.1 hypothetical protein CONCODRAFT_12492 [Conidiobolus coronatus NRRL 28638]
MNLPNYRIYTHFFAKFSQRTKIKKLSLTWNRLTNCSLESILLNCPHLEALYLNGFIRYMLPNLVKFLNFSNSSKLKKLAIDFNDLDEVKEVIKSIYEKCANLERLDIFTSNQMDQQELEDLFQAFYIAKFFTSSLSCKSILTHLNLRGFKAVDSKAEYFKNFEKLKSIKNLDQPKIDYNSLNQ